MGQLQSFSEKNEKTSITEIGMNMISTSIMIQLGHVKDNKMVDMQLSNQKLVDRGTQMIMEELKVDYDKAKTLLLQYGSVRAVLDAV